MAQIKYIGFGRGVSFADMYKPKPGIFCFPSNPTYGLLFLFYDESIDKGFGVFPMFQKQGENYAKLVVGFEYPFMIDGHVKWKKIDLTSLPNTKEEFDAFDLETFLKEAGADVR
jgi:hypothetical protein